MRGHDQLFFHQITREGGGHQVYGIQSPDHGGERLGSALQYAGSELDSTEGPQKMKNRLTAGRKLCVDNRPSQPQPIKGSEALHLEQRAGDAHPDRRPTGAIDWVAPRQCEEGPTNRRKQSSIALSLLEQEIHDVTLYLEGRRQGDIAKRRRVGMRLADLQVSLGPFVGDNPGNGLSTIEHRQDLTIFSNLSEVFGELGSQLTKGYFFHQVIVGRWS